MMVMKIIHPFCVLFEWCYFWNKSSIVTILSKREAYSFLFKPYVVTKNIHLANYFCNNQPNKVKKHLFWPNMLTIPMVLVPFRVVVSVVFLRL